MERHAVDRALLVQFDSKLTDCIQGPRHRQILPRLNDQLMFQTHRQKKDRKARRLVKYPLLEHILAHFFHI